MGLRQAVKAELLPADTLNLTIWFTVNPDGISTIRHTRAPLNFGIIFYVRLQKEALITINCIEIFGSYQFSNLVFITNSAALEFHACHSFALTLLYFHNKVMSPTCAARLISQDDKVHISLAGTELNAWATTRFMVETGLVYALI
jgi:hypothetical protein